MDTLPSPRSPPPALTPPSSSKQRNFKFGLPKLFQRKKEKILDSSVEIAERSELIEEGHTDLNRVKELISQNHSRVRDPSALRIYDDRWAELYGGAPVANKITKGRLGVEEFRDRSRILYEDVLAAIENLSLSDHPSAPIHSGPSSLKRHQSVPHRPSNSEGGSRYPHAVQLQDRPVPPADVSRSGTSSKPSKRKDDDYYDKSRKEPTRHKRDEEYALSRDYDNRRERDRRRSPERKYEDSNRNRVERGEKKRSGDRDDLDDPDRRRRRERERERERERDRDRGYRDEDYYSGRDRYRDDGYYDYYRSRDRHYQHRMEGYYGYDGYRHERDRDYDDGYYRSRRRRRQTDPEYYGRDYYDYSRDRYRDDRRRDARRQEKERHRSDDGGEEDGHRDVGNNDGRDREDRDRYRDRDRDRARRREYRDYDPREDEYNYSSSRRSRRHRYDDDRDRDYRRDDDDGDRRRDRSRGMEIGEHDAPDVQHVPPSPVLPEVVPNVSVPTPSAPAMSPTYIPYPDPEDSRGDDDDGRRRRRRSRRESRQGDVARHPEGHTPTDHDRDSKRSSQFTEVPPPHDAD